MITNWEEGVRLARELRETSLRKVPNFISETDLPTGLGHFVLDVPKQLLTPQELEITEGYNAVELLGALSSGRLTATEVTKAFLRRATLAQHLVNCVTEFLPEEALTRAAELDDHYAKTGKTVGPLHGLPISVKDHIGMKGKIASLGFCSMMDNVAENDADILVLLRSLGAIFHVRTTQPQMMYSIDTTSVLWGSTVTPWNRNLMAGGSSGGEGALVAMRGSLLGLATDIGGSIRVPAACNGVVGFRVSARRTPYDGILGTLYGSEQILCVLGPVATCAEDCELFLRTVINAEPWKMDPYCLRMPWRSVKPEPKSLTIGYLFSDEIVTPHPPVTRVLKEAVMKLEAAGFTLKEWTPFNHAECWDIISSLYFPDTGLLDKELLETSGEEVLPLSRWILHDNPNSTVRTIAESCSLVARRDRYKKEYLKRLLEAKVDFMLCPAMIGASLPVQTARSWAYTAQWNLLDYPAVVFRGGQVQPSDVKDVGYKALSEHDKYFQDLYSPEKFESAPVALQLVAQPYHDEELFAMLREVQTVLDVQ